MRRLRSAALIVAAAAVLAVPGGAQADYHPACIGIITGMDDISFEANEEEITYGGWVECPGSQRIDVDVTLSGAADDSVGASCDEILVCLGRVDAQGSVPLADGEYRVEMTFYVESVAALLTYDPTPRCGVWTVEDGTASGPTACPDPDPDPEN